MTRNAELAALFEEFADLLDAQGVEYKPRAYRRAAENILDHPIAIEALAREGPEAVSEIEGVGDAIASKVVEYIETGEIEELEDLRESLPVDMAALTRVEGVGPKTVGALYEELGITTLDELEAAAQSQQIRTVSGFGPKTEENILAKIPFARAAGERTLLGVARPLADDILGYVDSIDGVDRCETAGSIRRWCETIGDIDILVSTDVASSVHATIENWSRVDAVIESGEVKASVRIADTRVDLRFVAPDEFGSALQYFTGSKDHNVRLRNRAIDRQYKMNEYGVFDVSDVDDPADQRAGRRIAGETEDSMYEALDLPWIEPELREDMGEIDAAENDELPSLVTMDDINGDLHVHTDWSDGTASIESMAEDAAAFGHEYIAICDHAAGPGVVGGVGLTDDDLIEQRSLIEDISDSASITVLAGVEANIDGDGQLGISDDVLDELDLVVASPHSQLDMTTPESTNRLVSAMEHPAVTILGHPSGRLLGSRPGMDLDVEAIVDSAVRTNTALEVNANPSRLDLWDRAIKLAVDAGATIVINTDAHSSTEFSNIRYGVHTARRGWAEPATVLNSWDLDAVRAFC